MIKVDVSLYVHLQGEVNILLNIIYILAIGHLFNSPHFTVKYVTMEKATETFFFYLFHKKLVKFT